MTNDGLLPCLILVFIIVAIFKKAILWRINQLKIMITDFILYECHNLKKIKTEKKGQGRPIPTSHNRPHLTIETPMLKSK